MTAQPPRDIDLHGPLPVQRTAPRNRSSTQLQAATVLVADPAPGTRVSLSAHLAEAGFGRILQATSPAAVQQLIATRPPGQLALISLAFGADTNAIVHNLSTAGWPRLIALARGADTGPVIDACHAGISGVLCSPTAGPPAHDNPAVIPELSAREIQVIRWVAGGRTNKWIADQLTTTSPETVKSHLTRISRKLGTHDRAHIIATMIRGGIIS